MSVDFVIWKVNKRQAKGSKIQAHTDQAKSTQVNRVRRGEREANHDGKRGEPGAWAKGMD